MSESLHELAHTFRLHVSIEFVNYYAVGRGVVDRPALNRLNVASSSTDEACKGTRRVNHDQLGRHDATMFERGSMPVGTTIERPLVIEEPASTTVVFPDQKVCRDECG